MCMEGRYDRTDERKQERRGSVHHSSLRIAHSITLRLFDIKPAHTPGLVLTGLSISFVSLVIYRPLGIRQLTCIRQK